MANQSPAPRTRSLRLCAAAGLTLCIALLVFSFLFELSAGDDRVGRLEIFAGRVSFTTRRGLLNADEIARGSRGRDFRVRRGTSFPGWTSPFVWWFDQDGYGDKLGTRSLPLWIPGAACALVLALLSPRRRSPNACHRCAYPATGLPGPTCPECGTPTARTPRPLRATVE